MIARRLRSVLIAAGATAASSFGCGVPMADGSGAALNECSSAEDCGPGGTCQNLPAGRACIASSADLEGLLLEVQPPAGGGFVSGSSYLFPLGESHWFEGPAASGHVRTFDPLLPDAVRIHEGKILLKSGVDYCAAPDRSILASVELRRPAPYAGIPAATYSTQTTTQGPAPAPPEGDAGYSFDVELPPGTYDVYVMPTSLETCVGEDPDGEGGPEMPAPKPVPPPYFRRAQQVEQDTGLTVELPLPETLAVSLVVPQGQSFEGWSFDMADPAEGRVISTTQVLGAKAGTVSLEVRYYWFESHASPILRLRPPDGLVAPTVYWQLDSVDLDGDRKVELTLADLETAPIDVEAVVIDAQTAVPVAASISIHSKQLSGGAASNGIYELHTQTDETGFFRAKLVPGAYRVVALPTPNSDYAMARTEWTVSKDQCCAWTMQLGRRTRVEGTALGPDGTSIASALVIASPSLPGHVSYWFDALNASELPREALGATNAGGDFVLATDSGPFDFSVRPPDGSGYPWALVPRLVVEEGVFAKPLGTVTVPYPAVLIGRVAASASGKAVAGAVLRAWLPLQEEADAGKGAGTAVQIGEAIADGSGSYVLALPPSISR